MQKSPTAIETYNDLNGDVVNFFKIVRERPEELAYAIEWTPWARSEYEQAKASYEGDDLERARRFWIYQMMSVGADPGKGSNSGMRIENKVVMERWERLDRKQVVDGIFATAKRLRTVQIESRPMNELLMRLDSRIALFYIDPPYVSGTRTHGKDMYGNADIRQRPFRVYRDRAKPRRVLRYQWVCVRVVRAVGTCRLAS